MKSLWDAGQMLLNKTHAYWASIPIIPQGEDVVQHELCHGHHAAKSFSPNPVTLSLDSNQGETKDDLLRLITAFSCYPLDEETIVRYNIA